MEENFPSFFCMHNLTYFDFFDKTYKVKNKEEENEKFNRYKRLNNKRN